jgi:hypothetical protein
MIYRKRREAKIPNLGRRTNLRNSQKSGKENARGRCHQWWGALGEALCVPGQTAGTLRTTAAIHIASSIPIAMTMIVLDFTGLSWPPRRVNIAVWP